MRPEASRGGRPSSVRALRRAAHYPPTTSASGSLRLASWRSRGRTPRTRFCRSFLAWRSAASMGFAAARRACKCHRWCGIVGQAWATARRRASGPSERTPTIGTRKDWRTAVRRVAQASWVAERKLRARRTTPARPSRRPRGLPARHRVGGHRGPACPAPGPR